MQLGCERCFARAFASTLALVLTMACASAPRTTSEPGACTALTVRSSRGPRTFAGGAAAVPEGVWVLRDGRPATLTLFDHDRRVRAEIVATTLFPHRKMLRPLQLVGDGHVLAVLGQFDGGTSAVAFVAASGAITRVENIDIQGDLVAGPAGRFVVYDSERMRFVAGDRIVGRHDEPQDAGHHGWSPRVLAATASGYVEARATEMGGETIRVTVRWLDADGRPKGDAVELATFELDRGVFAVEPRIAAIGDGAAIVYRDFDGLQFARVGTPQHVLAGPTALWPDVRLSLDALAADEDAIWLTGSVFSRKAAASHDDRHIARLHVVRLDHQGRVTARGHLRTATGSAFRPRIVAVAPTGLFGIHHREVLGRLGSRRDVVFDRWLYAGCRSTRRFRERRRA